MQKIGHKGSQRHPKQPGKFLTSRKNS
jgi:hypothetical protein